MTPRVPVSRQRRYTRPAVLLHWIMGLLVISQIAVAFAMEAAAKDSPEQGMWFQLHATIAITILIMWPLRVVWRMTHRPPSLPHTVPHWQRASAHLVHYILYTLVLFMPLTGWAIVSVPAPAEPTILLWDIALPPMPGANIVEAFASAIGMKLGALHEMLAWVFISAIGIHVFAAILHHFVLRDEVLLRMVPSILHPIMHRLRGSRR